jgi:hypothetical protein
MGVRIGLSHQGKNTGDVSENGVVRKLFGSKREEASGDWRRLHNEELHNLYALPNIIRGVIKLKMGEIGGEFSTHEINEKYI